MWEYLIPILVFVFLLYFVASYRRIVVREYQRGVKFLNGRIVDVLEPGQHWIYKPRTEVVWVDIREKVVNLPGQEILSSDGITLRVSLVATYKISDPALLLKTSELHKTALYAKLQVGLRKFISGIPIEEVLQKRDDISKATELNTRDEIAAMGIELISVDIRDIMFPGVLKQIFAEELRARKEGLAALERARGETAALRNLANAARLMKDNPSLMQLRLLQALTDSTGNTLVVNLAQDNTMIPLPKGQD